MKTILREGGLVIIERDNGEWWLTKRKHRPKDTRGRKRLKKSVFYIPIKRIPKEGDWLFTCKNYPVQFGKSLDDYELKDWFNYPKTNELPFDDFETLDGSCHSIRHCSLNLISEKYAKWYIEHKIFDLFYDRNDENVWVNMERKVKDLCTSINKIYEGI